jgi:hypothetical protein
MLFLNIILHEWKKGIRGQGFYKSIVVNILLILFAIGISAVLLALGYSLGSLLEKLNKSMNPLQFMNGAMLYLMFLGWTVRFFMQQLNTINLTPYQTLPIKHSALINLILLKPLLNPLNYFTFFIIIPFALHSVAFYYSLGVALQFIFCLVFGTWFNSLLIAFLKRKFGADLRSFVFLFFLLALIIWLEYNKHFSLFAASSTLFNFIIFNPFGLLIPLTAVIMAFALNKWFFTKYYYPESVTENLIESKIFQTNLNFLYKFGEVGALMYVYVKLIFRHRRTRSILYMSVFFLTYGLVIYTNDLFFTNDGLLYLVSVFITGMLTFMFGQWIISWDGSHFDSLMTQNISIRTYLNANYLLLIIFDLICFLLTTPYLFLGNRLFYLHLAALIFNMGINVYLLLLFSTLKNKTIELSKDTTTNYQGTTYKSYFVVFIVLLLPLSLILLITRFTTVNTAISMLTAVGLIGIFMQKQLMTVCVNQFNRRKYKMAKGFRINE